MSVGHYHAMCNRCMGKAVEIRTRDGRIHRGVIHRVTPTHVYLQPLGGPRNLGGFGYGFGWGWGGFGLGIGLGFIAGLAVLPWFFW